MNTLVNTKIGENRGLPRLWLEGNKIAHSFKPGDRFDLLKDIEKRRMSMTKNEYGKYRVSVRNKNGKQLPLIELKGDAISDVFDVSMLVRVVVRKGQMLVEVHGKEVKQVKRVTSFLSKLQNQEPITFGSLLTGGGILDAAIHEGLKRSNIECYTKFAVERDSKYVESLVSNQSNLFRDDSIIVESPIELVECKSEISVDIIIGSLPCNGASKAGITKNKIASCEFHSDAGATFHYWLNFIENSQPVMAVMENVVEFFSSASMAVMRTVLDNMGYDLHETTLNGVEYGCLENRERKALVAVTRGLSAIKEFNFDSVIPLRKKEATLNDVLETLPEDHKSWRTYSYLADKEVRDAISKKGFKREMITGSETSLGTVRRLYHKAGSCDQFVIHPNNPTLSRLLTPSEHARVKAIPHHMVEGISNTIAHEIMGQSVCFPAFESLGKGIGDYFVELNNLQSSNIKTRLVA